MDTFVQNIQNNPFILFLIVVIIFLLTVLIYGRTDRGQDVMRRFIETLSGLLEAAGEALIDITNTTLGLLEMCADFFEVLRYILFGNFHSHIRFIVANYTILFASIVSFVTTLFGLCQILNWGLALVLSFTIQTALVLTSLSCAQNFSKKQPRCKRVVRYTISCKGGTLYEKQPEYGERDWKSGFVYLFFLLPLIFLSSSLTYVYIYDEKLEDYVLYKTAYDVMAEIEEDVSQNQAQLNQYFYSMKEVMIAFKSYAGTQSGGGKDVNELIHYLESADGTEEEKEESKKILEDFEKHLGDLKAKESKDNNDKESFQIAAVLLFPDSREEDQVQIELPQIHLLAENAVHLKLYKIDQLKDMTSKRDELRTYLADHVLSTEGFPESKNDQDEKNDQSEKNDQGSNTLEEADSGNIGNKGDSDNQKIRELVKELILETQELYRQIPELHDISVQVIYGSQTGENNPKVRLLWKSPVKNNFAEKYTRYLEITDSRLTLVSQAFRALSGVRNLFLKFIYGLCYSADVIIFLVCFVRSSQRPGKSIRMRKNLVYSIFIQPKDRRDKKTENRKTAKKEDGAESRARQEGQTGNKSQKRRRSQKKCRNPIEHWDEGNVLHCLLNSNALNLLKFCEIVQLYRSMEVYQISGSVDGTAARLFSGDGKKLLSKQEDRRDEWYVGVEHVRSAGFYQDMLLLYSAGLAYPVMDLNGRVTGYVLTKGCIHDLLQSLFDTARRRGVDARVFKEDLKEYEEDTWED